jgi:hypothetical protein
MSNDKEREALMDLIDAYAEARHVGGCHTYNAKTAEARDKVVASIAASAGSEPVAIRDAIANFRLTHWADEDGGLGLADALSQLYGDDNIGRASEELDSLADAIADAAAHPSPPEGMVGGWTQLPGQLPEPGMPVLLDIGKKFPIRAMWAAKHTVEAHYEADPDWTEYDEATDQHYCPQGWYEWNEHEEVHWAVSATPRAWAQMPPPPSAEGVSHGEGG